MSICVFDITKFKKIVEKDFDFEHPIPKFLLPYPYIYTSGSSTNEVIRYFILPNDIRITLSNDSESFRYIDKIKRTSLIMIAHTEFLHDIICGNIYSINGNKNPEIRYKRKLVKEFSDDEIKDYMSQLGY
jgi:hypothetical protein